MKEERKKTRQQSIFRSNILRFSDGQPSENPPEGWFCLSLPPQCRGGNKHRQPVTGWVNTVCQAGWVSGGKREMEGEGEGGGEVAWGKRRKREQREEDKGGEIIGRWREDRGDQHGGGGGGGRTGEREMKEATCGRQDDGGEGRRKMKERADNGRGQERDGGEEGKVKERSDRETQEERAGRRRRRCRAVCRRYRGGASHHLQGVQRTFKSTGEPTSMSKKCSHACSLTNNSKPREKKMNGGDEIQAAGNWQWKKKKKKKGQMWLIRGKHATFAARKQVRAHIAVLALSQRVRVALQT